MLNESPVAVTLDATSPVRPPAVQAVEITRRYGEGESAVDALRGVSLDVPDGQFTAVMGPSGSGQVDADAHPRRPRPAHHGRGLDRRPRTSRR